MQLLELQWIDNENGMDFLVRMNLLHHLKYPNVLKTFYELVLNNRKTKITQYTFSLTLIPWSNTNNKLKFHSKSICITYVF